MGVDRHELTLTAETPVAVWPGAHVSAQLVNPMTSERPPGFGGSSIVVAGDGIDLIAVVADHDGIARLPLLALDADFAGYGWLISVGGTPTYTIRQLDEDREFGKDLIIDTPAGVDAIQIPGPPGDQGVPGPPRTAAEMEVDPSAMVVVSSGVVQGAMADLDGAMAATTQAVSDAQVDLVGGAGVRVVSPSAGVVSVGLVRSRVMVAGLEVDTDEVSLLPAPVAIDPSALTDIVIPVLCTDPARLAFHAGDASWTVELEVGATEVRVTGLTSVPFSGIDLVGCTVTWTGSTTGCEIQTQPVAAPPTELDITIAGDGGLATVTVPGLTITHASIDTL